VDHVATEYGVASPLGRSLAERARELINIAHPDHRDQLRFDAHRAVLLPWSRTETAPQRRDMNYATRIRIRTKKESWPTPLPIR
jgi:acyl-CoA hydrolase